MSYYEQKIAALEARIEEMANLERMKAVKVEAQLMVRLGELNAENARLKAEVEKLTFDPLSYLDDAGEWMPRHTHLAAVARLKAEVERLTKAGDAMASNTYLMLSDEDGAVYDTDLMKFVQAWNAAKEGKQP